MSQSEDPDKPSDAVAEEPEEVKNETEDGAKPARKKREITPEYRQILIERLSTARKTKQKAKAVGMKIPRKIVPDADQKQNYCEICKRSYASSYGLKLHCRKFHGEKKISQKVKDAEDKAAQDKAAEEKASDAPETKAEEPKKDNEIVVVPTETVVDKDRLLIAKQAPPPPPAQPAKTLRKPPSEPRYTLREFRSMEARHKENMKKREKEIKAQRLQQHILESIAIMKSGGLR